MRRAADVLGTLGAPAEMVGWAAEAELDIERVWEECPRGDWLIALAVRAGVERRAVVRATASCARLALARIPEDDKRARKALEAAEQWAESGLKASACWAAAFGAADARGSYQSSDPAASAAAGAAAATAFACDEAADDAYWMERAYPIEAVRCAADALTGAALSEEEAQQLLAQRVRSRLGWDVVHVALPATVRRSERPLPPSGNPDVQRASVIVPSAVKGAPPVRIELQRPRRSGG